MTTDCLEKPAEHLYRYVLASADMFFEEFEEREVLIDIDDQGHFQIWGEIADEGPTSRVSLCQVLLEYGLRCCCSRSPAEARHQMGNFGTELGHSIARCLRAHPALLRSENPATHALEQVLGTIGAGYSIEYTETSVTFKVTDCPLENTAKSCGLSNLELAHCGMNAMCRSLLLDMDPNLVVEISPDMLPEFKLSIRQPMPA